MKIPDVLKGKVPRTNSEMLVSTGILNRVYGVEYKDEITDNDVEEALINSQPFTPEMITEYLDGWVFDIEEENYWYWHNSKQANCIVLKKHYNFMEIWNLDENFKTIYPRTWNDFLSDLERAGINAKYKGE